MTQKQRVCPVIGMRHFRIAIIGLAVFRSHGELHAPDGRMISHDDFIITPNGFDIPFESGKVHGISTALAKRDGADIKTVVESFLAVVDQADFLVGHNLKFDLNIMAAELLRLGKENTLTEKAILDTCTEDTALLCELPGGRGESLNSLP